MEDLIPWFALKSVAGIGNHLFKRLIQHFGTPQDVFKAKRDQLAGVKGMTHRLAAAIQAHQLPDPVKRDIERVAQERISIVTMADSAYPTLLMQIPDPPPFLYVKGCLHRSQPGIAMVGSRNATEYGMATTQRLSADLASLGLTVVSGMAVGIDTAAHLGALSIGGHTIAVMGCGLDNIYPKQNAGLFAKIADSGAVISEFPMLTEPEAHNFPVRNRVISGMTLGTVVVEATKRSGSLITARLAAEQNREVFAVPGSIHSFKSSGTHTLIKQGAKLVENAQDILEEIQPAGFVPLFADKRHVQVDEDPLPTMSSDEVDVYNNLGPYPVHIDDLSRQIQMDVGTLSSTLLQLELKGVVHQSPGKFFQILKPKP